MGASALDTSKLALGTHPHEAARTAAAQTHTDWSEMFHSDSRIERGLGGVNRGIPVPARGALTRGLGLVEAVHLLDILFQSLTTCFASIKHVAAGVFVDLNARWISHHGHLVDGKK